MSKKSFSIWPVAIGIAVIGFFAFKDKGPNSDTKRKQLLENNPSGLLDENWKPAISQMTADEIEAVYEYYFFYVPIDKQPEPGSNFEQKLINVFNKYNLS